MFSTWNPSKVQLPNLIEQCWSSKGNQVMSIWQEDCKQDLYSTKVGKRITLKMPGGMYVQVPSEVTTTLVGNVPSKASLALQLTWDLTFFRWTIRVHSETDVFPNILASQQ